MIKGYFGELCYHLIPKFGAKDEKDESGAADGLGKSSQLAPLEEKSVSGMKHVKPGMGLGVHSLFVDKDPSNSIL